MSATSLAAFNGTGRKQMRSRVLAAIAECGLFGITDDELQVLLKSDSQAVTPARLSLERKGFIFWSGFTRVTRDGFEAMVWVVPAFDHAPRRPELDYASGYCPACGRGRRTHR